MPPHLTGRLTYDPPLPRKRAQLVQRAPMASIIKVGEGVLWPGALTKGAMGWWPVWPGQLSLTAIRRQISSLGGWRLAALAPQSTPSGQFAFCNRIAARGDSD